MFEDGRTTHTKLGRERNWTDGWQGEYDKRQVPVGGKALMDAMDSCSQKQGLQSIMQMLARRVVCRCSGSKMRTATSFERFYSRVDELFPPVAGAERWGSSSATRTLELSMVLLRPLTSLSPLSPFLLILLTTENEVKLPAASSPNTRETVL